MRDLLAASERHWRTSLNIPTRAGIQNIPEQQDNNFYLPNFKTNDAPRVCRNLVRTIYNKPPGMTLYELFHLYIYHGHCAATSAAVVGSLASHSSNPALSAGTSAASLHGSQWLGTCDDSPIPTCCLCSRGRAAED